MCHMNNLTEGHESLSQNPLIRVGILSDTHGSLSDAAYAALADSDHLIHAGDIGSPEVFRALGTIAPTTAVLGNNDFDEYGSEVARFAKPVIGGIRFLIAHYPQEVDLGKMSIRMTHMIKPGDPLPHVCIHGHTHVPKILSGKEAGPAQYIICPGSISRPRMGSKPSVVKMLITQNRILDLWLEEL